MSSSQYKLDVWAFSALELNAFGHIWTHLDTLRPWFLWLGLLRHDFCSAIVRRFEEWRYLGVLEHLAGLQHGSTGSVSWIGMESEVVTCDVQPCSGVGGVGADADVERYVLGSIPEEASVVVVPPQV